MPTSVTPTGGNRRFPFVMLRRILVQELLNFQESNPISDSELDVDIPRTVDLCKDTVQLSQNNTESGSSDHSEQGPSNINEDRTSLNLTPEVRRRTRTRRPPHRFSPSEM